MKKKIYMAALLITLASMTVGCNNVQNRDEISESEAEKQSMEIPKELNTTQNGVSFELKPKVPDHVNFTNIPKCSAVKQSVNNEAAQNLFLKNRTIESEGHDEGSGEDGTKFDIYYASYSDDASLYLSGLSWSFATRLSGKVDRSFRIDVGDESNENLYSKDREFSFASLKEAVEMTVDAVSASGMKFDEYAYDSYALDYETMQKEEVFAEKAGDVISDKHSEWSEADDCYMLYLMQEHNKIPVYFGTSDFLGTEDTNRPVQAIVSQAGIEYLMVQDLFQFTDEKERYQLTAFETVTECVAHKYGDVLTGAEYQVTGAELFLVPVKKPEKGYEMHLAWLFTVHETGTDSEFGDYDNILYTIVDAETGEELTI